MPGEAELVRRIERLRCERQALVLAHHYQTPRIQELADLVGDALELAREAARSNAPVVVLCGARSMAENAALLCPEKTVLIPDSEAECSLAAGVRAEDVRAWRAQYPGAVVVSHIHTRAEVKAESDCCCTTANALATVESIPKSRPILFLPDLFLGDYVQRRSGRKLVLWKGECQAGASISPREASRMLKQHPDSRLLIHPECGCVSRCLAALAGGVLPEERLELSSPAEMLGRAKRRSQELVGAEPGLLHHLHRADPETPYLPVARGTCEFLRKVTLAGLHRSLHEGVTEVRIPDGIAARARPLLENLAAAG